jgi:hypothetical protein
MGKTHVAMALAHRAVTAGHKVRFIDAADLMLQLAAVNGQGVLRNISTALCSGRSCWWSTRVAPFHSPWKRPTCYSS